MNILCVLDVNINIQKFPLKSIGRDDTVYLFPLTSSDSLVEVLVCEIGKRARSVEVIPSAEIINSCAEVVRGKYLRFVADLPYLGKIGGKNLKEYFRLDKTLSMWWLSSIAEKSTLNSGAFNTLVQLEAITASVTNKKITKIIVGCRCARIRKAIKDFCRKYSLQACFASIGGERTLKLLIKDFQGFFYFKHILILCFCILGVFRRTCKIKRAMKRANRPLGQEDPLLFVTYFPYFDILLAQKGIFRNKFFAGLDESLYDQGRSVVWAAIYAQNNSISLDESLKFARRFIENGNKIFFVEEFNDLFSHLKALWMMVIMAVRFLKIEGLIRRHYEIGDYNFYSLFRDEWYLSFVGKGGYTALLYFYGFRELLKKVKAKKCLYFLEMQIWEKALIFARDSLPSPTAMLGYQHATISRFLLNYFNDQKEIAVEGPYPAARPDKIFCNGRIPYNYMLESGWPPGQLEIVEAIRYSHLKSYMNTDWPRKRNVVLLAFSISIEEGSSILTMVQEAFKNVWDVEIWLKPHPFLSIQKVLEMVRIDPQNLNFRIRNEPIESLLPEAKVVIAGESGVSVEALLFGCFVVSINTPERINMSPLKHIDSGQVRTVHSPRELRAVVQDILADNTNHGEYKVQTRELVNRFLFLDQSSQVPENFLRVLQN